jgi:hypothetical protein
MKREEAVKFAELASIIIECHWKNAPGTVPIVDLYG